MLRLDVTSMEFVNWITAAFLCVSPFLVVLTLASLSYYEYIKSLSGKGIQLFASYLVPKRVLLFALYAVPISGLVLIMVSTVIFNWVLLLLVLFSIFIAFCILALIIVYIIQMRAREGVYCYAEELYLLVVWTSCCVVVACECVVL